MRKIVLLIFCVFLFGLGCNNLPGGEDTAERFMVPMSAEEIVSVIDSEPGLSVDSVDGFLIIVGDIELIKAVLLPNRGPAPPGCTWFNVIEYKFMCWFDDELGYRICEYVAVLIGREWRCWV